MGETYQKSQFGYAALKSTIAVVLQKLTEVYASNSTNRVDTSYKIDRGRYLI